MPCLSSLPTIYFPTHTPYPVLDYRCPIGAGRSGATERSPPMRPSTVLRRMLDEPEIIALPGAYDALTARLAERAGFRAVFTTGFGFAATVLGMPDLGLLTMTETMDRVRHIVRALSVPLVADMDTGYGNALNVVRTVRECVALGVAGIILEDQEWPKKCGHFEGNRVIPAEEQC